jgi:hypothetical protein
MRILPLIRETLVLPFPENLVEKRLWEKTMPIKPGEEMADIKDDEFLFDGWVKNGHFRISRKLKHPEIFMPILKGSIEPTSSGCIVFIRYRLSFSTAFLVIFWTIATLLIGLYFLLLEKIYGYAILSFLFGGINYWIAMVNFNMQSKKSSQVINQLLS